jgi:ABC-type multidrug transport system fused ATPase/permease subunit
MAGGETDAAVGGDTTKRSPYDAVGWWGTATFSWMTPLFNLKGVDLAAATDVAQAMESWSLPADDQPSKHAQLLETAWRQETSESGGVVALEAETEAAGGEERSKLAAVMWRVYGVRWMRTGALKAVGFLSVVATPLLIRTFLEQLQRRTQYDAGVGGSTEKPWPVWALLLLVPVMTLASLLYTVCWHQYMQLCMRIGLCARSGTLMLIYRKTLRLTAQQLASSSNMEVNNLVTSDAERIGMGLMFSHFAWGSPIEILLGTFLAFLEIGWPAFVALGLLLLQVPVQANFGRLTSKLRRRVATETDERVRVMNELLSGMASIKLQCQEASFLSRVATSRSREISKLWRMQMTLGANRSLSFITGMLVSLTAFWLYELKGHDLTIAKAFVCLAYFRQIELAITMLPLAIDAHVQLMVATRRIDSFLAIPEAGHRDSEHSRPESGFAAQLIGASFRWSTAKGGEPSTNPSAPQGGGSGGDDGGGGGGGGGGDDDGDDDENIREAMAAAAPSAAAAAQHHCLTDISLGLRTGRLHGVIGRVGSGKSSLMLSLLGETTLTAGELAIDTSQPISYVSQQPWVINASVRDNILMGRPYVQARYDAVVSACALEADLRQMTAGDATELGERGVTISGGQQMRVALARACYSHATLVLLDDPLAAVDAHVGRHVFTEAVYGLLLAEGRTVLMATHQLHTVPRMDRVWLLEQGRVVSHGTPAEVAKAAHPLAQELQQQLAGNADEPQTADPQQVQVHAIEHKEEPVVPAEPAANAADHAAGGGSSVMVQEGKNAGQVTLRTLRDYMAWGGRAPTWVGTLCCFLLAQTLKIYGDIWIAVWAETSDPLPVAGTRVGVPFVDDPATISKGDYAFWFFILTLGVFAAGLLRSLAFTHCVLHAADSLHRCMCSSVLGSPMVFFESNPLGRIINRFSNDLVSSPSPKMTAGFLSRISHGADFAAGSSRL